MEEHKFGLLGKLILSKGVTPIKTGELKAKLSSIWGINAVNWVLIPLGKGFHNVNLSNTDDKSRVFCRGSIFLKPGVFRLSQWVPDFNPNNKKQTNA